MGCFSFFLAQSPCLPLRDTSWLPHVANSLIQRALSSLLSQKHSELERSPALKQPSSQLGPPEQLSEHEPTRSSSSRVRSIDPHRLPAPLDCSQALRSEPHAGTPGTAASGPEKMRPADLAPSAEQERGRHRGGRSVRICSVLLFIQP